MIRPVWKIVTQVFVLSPLLSFTVHPQVVQAVLRQAAIMMPYYMYLQAIQQK